MDQKAKLRELELQTKTATLAQTEQDLANAVIIIQDREAELAQGQKERDQLPVQKPKSIIPNLAITADDADNAEPMSRPTTSGFGTSFPDNPQKGDLFLRVDTLPNSLYKWNGKKWIEIDKTINDRYAYDEEYIKYLLQKVRTGEIHMDDLSRPEKEQIVDRLSYYEKGKLL